MVRQKRDIGERYTSRADAEWYRDRFKRGRRRTTHDREVAALESLVSTFGRMNAALDVGSGPGRFAPTILGHADRLIQADFSIHMLNVSRQDFPYPPNQTGYAQADVRLLPFPSNSFDMVFCHRLLNHLPDPTDRTLAFAELARVSRRYVVISCLAPLIGLRMLRRAFVRLKGGDPSRTFVDLNDFLGDAERAGLKLQEKRRIRPLGPSSAFFAFVKS